MDHTEQIRGRGPAGGPNGHVVKAKRIRVVPNIRVETVTGERMLMMMLGEKEPELACQMTTDDARKLAGALVQHADAAERETLKIILPGGSLILPTQGDIAS